MAGQSDLAKRREQQKKRQQEKMLLDDEEEGREKRIQLRKRQRLKADAEKKVRKRKRMFKVAGAWIGVIFVGFMVVTWFSKEFVSWFHDLIN